MTREQASDFGWFTAWVDGYLGLCVTFARGRSWEQMLEGFGIRPEHAVEETFEEADADPNRPKVRVGTHEEWGYAVEHFTSRGSDPETLCRLSANGGEALALSYTQTIKLFMYAANGELVNGFDLDAPRLRYGRDEHRFDSAIAQAGFVPPGVRGRTPAMGARFVQLTFGITLTLGLLERRLPSAELPWDPRTSWWPRPPAE
jgi:hypothetical protein